ncbi:MAG: hypothetical protein CMD92_07785 [Gammaproteobacteria bacterium]|nr:hypothetical protein [Gammaproteobacteria bacterium]HBW84996.1 hypothetical protein [Gammaproteobacteria bacterium]|tara:strand:+ start:631 stop:888 length:258 start_codon:yes stop_codon:yes gene_type:complete
MTNDKRTALSDTDINIDQRLIDEGTAQLNSEILVLENWLAELETAAEDDAEAVAARKSYHDMLSSRREMLSALAKQAKLQAVTTK